MIELLDTVLTIALGLAIILYWRKRRPQDWS
jgi:hypothetical protein